MRVVAGLYKGTVLEAPVGNDTRPTKEMVREALFSSLGNINGENFLDLFAGSGAMGIEALSRGAISFLNDVSVEAVEVIQRNLRKIKREDVLCTKKEALSFLEETTESFDIIFCDPPYVYARKEALVALIEQRNLLRRGGCFIYEEHAKIPLQEELSGLRLWKVKKYGISRICIYKYK